MQFENRNIGDITHMSFLVPPVIQIAFNNNDFIQASYFSEIERGRQGREGEKETQRNRDKHLRRGEGIRLNQHKQQRKHKISPSLVNLHFA